MEESNLEITIEVLASEDADDKLNYWELESITVTECGHGMPFTAIELQVLFDSLNGGEMNPVSDGWHIIQLERIHVNNGYLEPPHDFYKLKQMRTIEIQEFLNIRPKPLAIEYFHAEILKEFHNHMKESPNTDITGTILNDLISAAKIRILNTYF